MSEAATWLRGRAGLQAALAFHNLLMALRTRHELRVIWVDEEIETAAWRIMEQYAQLVLSLTDATSAVIARQQRVSQVFGFDSDFRVLGFVLGPTI